MQRVGMDLLEGAIDNHIHACPHLNARSLSVFDAVREAADAGMRAIGLMDNFCNTSGYAALAMREIGHLGVEVFGGLIMEPPAGGVTLEAVEAAIGYGYGPGQGAKFVSMPTHHTRHIAMIEDRSPAYTDACFAIPSSGPLLDPMPAILDKIAQSGIVLNTGHISANEAIRLVEHAKSRGIERILVPSSHYAPDAIAELTGAGAVAEFSFFFISHATQVGLTHVDAERHTVPPVSLPEFVARIAAAAPGKAICNSDAGVFVLPPPVEALREFLLLLKSAGIDDQHLREMTSTTPARLFDIALTPT